MRALIRRFGNLSMVVIRPLSTSLKPNFHERDTTTSLETFERLATDALRCRLGIGTFKDDKGSLSTARDELCNSAQPISLYFWLSANYTNAGHCPS